MHINKLTITPISSSTQKFTVNKPSQCCASTLIKERLESGYQQDSQRVSRIFRKIPKILKGWVNPETKVPNVRPFSMND